MTGRNSIQNSLWLWRS